MKEAIKFFVLISVLVLSLGVVNGSLVEESKTGHTEVYPGEQLSYNVTLLNTGNSTEYVSMLLLPSFGSLNEMSPNNLYLEPNQRQKVQITIRVSSDVQPGNRAFFINFYNEDGSKRKDTEILLRANIKGEAEVEETLDYDNVKISNVETDPAKVDPRESFSIKFESQNPYESIQVPLVVSYDGEKIGSSAEIPHGNGTVTVSDISISDDVASGEHKAEIAAEFTEEDVVRKEFDLKVSGYTSCEVNESLTSGMVGKEW